jgi:hypothetical protein
MLSTEVTQKVSNISRIMQFKVTAIEFDYDQEDEMDAYDKDRLACEVMMDTWEAEDDDDLVEEITAATGWCINSIEFVNIVS